MLDILNTTQTKFTLSKSKLLEIKDFILGKDFELSIVIVGEKKIQNLNRDFRNKNYPTDVLSFPLSEKTGEIFFNRKVAIKKATNFNMSQNQYFYYLMIHSMLHLKGHVHGHKMENREQEILKKFKIL